LLLINGELTENHLKIDNLIIKIIKLIKINNNFNIFCIYFPKNVFQFPGFLAAIKRMPYLGGGTRLARALAFAAGFLARSQNMRRRLAQGEHPTMPTPHHDRLQTVSK
jgi:hypothetical protein